MIIHEQYMRRCIQLAALAGGRVLPNPLVGAVLVHNDIIIGEGYHKAYGLSHAEVECVNNVKKEHQHLISESTLYVNLEPCAHDGKTPPCANFIVNKKIKKVVIGSVDTTDKVNGKGISILKNAGIEIISGILGKECIALNKVFFHAAKMQLPFITAKWAQSADGFINAANNTRTIISNEMTQRFVHQLRASHQAILVGRNTIVTDNPLLNARYWQNQHPIIVVIDRYLSIQLNSFNITKAKKLIIINTIKEGVDKNIQFIKVNANSETFEVDICKRLFELNIQSILIEGGAFTINKFNDAKLLSEAIQVVNKNLYLHSGVTAPYYAYFKVFQSFTLSNNELYKWTLH